MADPDINPSQRILEAGAGKPGFRLEISILVQTTPRKDANGIAA